MRRSAQKLLSKSKFPESLLSDSCTSVIVFTFTSVPGNHMTFWMQRMLWQSLCDLSCSNDLCSWIGLSNAVVYLHIWYTDTIWSSISKPGNIFNIIVIRWLSVIYCCYNIAIYLAQTYFSTITIWCPLYWILIVYCWEASDSLLRYSTFVHCVAILYCIWINAFLKGMLVLMSV